MTKRQFLLGTFILVTILAFGSTIGYFSLETSRVNANAIVEKEKIRNEEKTQRTKERGSIISKLPFMRKEK